MQNIAGRVKQVLLILGMALIGYGCGGDTAEIVLDDEPYDPVINPADFVAGAENPYFPLKAGTTYLYEGDTGDGHERIQVEITDATKEILGVLCVVVHDRVWLDDELEEDTYDWYATDKEGNVWYFGEDSKEIRGGVPVSTHGSWEAGVNGAKPGIVMKANPQISNAYRQEFFKGEAEDMAEVLSLNESVTVPQGSYANVLKTKEWTPLEPDIVEHKFYAKGVGLVMETVVKGGEGRIELIEVKTGG